MAQKPLKKQGKSVTAKGRPAANKHGKSQQAAKKGKLDLAPKRTAIKKTHEDSLRLTKAINADNEEHFAGMAAKSGGRLTLFQVPVNATANDKKNKPKVRPAKAGSQPWGASGK